MNSAERELLRSLRAKDDDSNAKALRQLLEATNARDPQHLVFEGEVMEGVIALGDLVQARPDLFYSFCLCWPHPKGAVN